MRAERTKYQLIQKNSSFHISQKDNPNNICFDTEEEAKKALKVLRDLESLGI